MRCRTGTTAPAASSTQDSAAQFAKDLAAFTKQPLDMPPDQAAAGWLALFDRSTKLQNGANPLAHNAAAPRAVFSALPGPGSWPLSQKMIQDRPPSAPRRARVILQLILDTLNNAEDRQWSDLDAIAPLLLSALAGT